MALTVYAPFLYNISIYRLLEFYMNQKCARCPESYPLTSEFWQKDSYSKSGFSYYCKPCSTARQKAWRKNNPVRYKELDQKQKDKNRDKNIQSRRNLRIDVLKHYSGHTPCCGCCGENELIFLVMDHVNGGGNAHTKEHGIIVLYWWLKKNNYPEGFQVLCHNCNFAKHILGICLHQNRLSTL
jgi:hypothetical protein